MKKLNFPQGSMPILGLGTWKSEPGEVFNAVKEAVKIGYRHIDCAAIYGNEAEIGKAIAELIAEGTVTREELWITSKLWNNAHGQDNVMPALQKTLADLQLEYLDLYLIHWPIAHKPNAIGAEKADDYIALEDQPIIDTWKGMENAVEKGLTKNIGVSNFSIKKLEDLLTKATIKPSLNQVELHPYFPQKSLVDYCQSQNIHMMAYSPLGSSDRPKGLKAENEPILLQDETLKAIADKKGVSIAQLILAWDIKRNISPIPKSVNPARLKQNLDAAEVEITDDELAEINALDKNRRYLDGKFWELEGGPYTLANIWDE